MNQKTSIAIMGSLLLILGSFSAFAADEMANPFGTQVSFTVTGDSYTLDIKQVYQAPLANVKAALMNGPLLVSLSNTVKSVSTQPLFGSQFVLTTDIVKDGKTKVVVSNCQDTSEPTRFERSCKLDTSKGDTGSLFYPGGTQTTTCESSSSISGSTECNAHFEGQVKGVSLFWGAIQRNGARLALDGAVEFSHDFGALWRNVSLRESPSDAFDNAQSSILQTQLNRLYNDESGPTNSGAYDKVVLHVSLSDMPEQYQRTLSNP